MSRWKALWFCGAGSSSLLRIYCDGVNMAHMSTQTYTTQEAAKRLHVTDSRIRQVLLESQGIGRKHGLAWILTDDDIHRLGLIVGKKSKTPLA